MVMKPNNMSFYFTLNSELLTLSLSLALSLLLYNNFCASYHLRILILDIFCTYHIYCRIILVINTKKTSKLANPTELMRHDKRPSSYHVKHASKSYILDIF